MTCSPHNMFSISATFARLDVECKESVIKKKYKRVFDENNETQIVGGGVPANFCCKGIPPNNSKLLQIKCPNREGFVAKSDMYIFGVMFRAQREPGPSIGLTGMLRAEARSVLPVRRRA